MAAENSLTAALFDTRGRKLQSVATQGMAFKLAIPEHGLFWPLVVCPLAGLLVAGIWLILE